MKPKTRSEYPFREIEPRWQKFWEENRTFRAEDHSEKPKYYVLDMFPYPSGAGLHVGHPEGYTATDIVCRYKRMRGFNVLHPMGWDAFGLPAERAAVRENTHPAIITRRNIDNFRRQIKRLGFSYDWDREVSTADPSYYRWTQWIFLKLYEKGLAYRADVPVNWCPALKTVLANEEVKDGRYVETGDPVERRLMRQWMLRITDYAERLLEGLDDLDWPESIKEMQRNWIGKSVGADIVFEIDGEKDLSFTAFTTRPDTLMGATYCVLAPEHPLVGRITTPERREAVEAYVREAMRKSDLARTDLAKEKTGVFTGAMAVHPVSGERIPIWIADYVLMSYGTGAIMAVPAHDERDHEFARTYGLPIVEVVRGGARPVQEEAFVGEGTAVNSGFIDGLPTPDAARKMTEWLEEHGRGRARVQYRLRDWLFSRQRYWGEPFPIVLLDDDEVVPVPEEELPVELPEIDDYRPTEDARPPLARAGDDWAVVTLPDGRVGRRETNTMPQWAGSCWYYLRFIDPRNDRAAWDPEKERYWMPVDLYVGGAEHAVLHLLYARFWHMVLYDLGLVSTPEPFARLVNQGMILGLSYRDSRGRIIPADRVEHRDGKAFDPETGEELEEFPAKMSKSLGNVVNPDDIIDDYGADAMRMYEMFMGPLADSKPWNTQGLEGISRFLGRVWRLFVAEDGALHPAITDEEPADDLQRLRHRTIRQVTDDIEALHFNTAISALMVMANGLRDRERRPRGVMEDFVLLLSPFAPHLAEELWRRLGHEESLAYHPWPVAEEKWLREDVVTVVVMVNGKVRDRLKLPAGTPEDEAREAALASPKVASRLEGRTVRRIVVVPDKIVNIAVS